MSQGMCCEPELTPTGTGGTPQLAYSPNPSLFYEKLTYDGIDIDQIDMSLDCNLGMLRNVYAYDGDHRILEQANTLLGTVHIPDAYSTSYTYDPAGNIQTLNRRGFTGMLGNAMQFNDIDSLAYTYVGGSKLDTIYDSITTDSLRAFGYPLQSGAYGYDGAGNITYNPVTSASIDYNMIDLPVHIAGNKDFDYLYTYSGEKFREIRYDGDTTIRTYIGAMQYVNDTLESVHHADGRLLLIQGDSIPHYQYKISDHLGNTVAFFEDFNGDGLLDSTEVLLKKLYYPFGMELEGVVPDTTAPNFIHLYNGKEYLEEVGWYDYGARWYDPAIGRFTGVDPIAEQFAHVSVYNYAENEPIAHIDLWGLQKYFYMGKFVAQRGTSNQLRVINDGSYYKNKIGVENALAVLTGPKELFSDPAWDTYLQKASYRVWEATQENEVEVYGFWGNTNREKTLKLKREHTMTLYSGTLTDENGNNFTAFMMGTTGKGIGSPLRVDPKTSFSLMKGWETPFSNCHIHPNNFEFSNDPGKGPFRGGDVQYSLGNNLPLYLLYAKNSREIKIFDPAIYRSIAGRRLGELSPDDQKNIVTETVQTFKTKN